MMFEPFYSTRFTGPGLGLPIALGAVKSWSGCITVATTPGKGIVFKVFLPVIDAAVTSRKTMANNPAYAEPENHKQDD